MIAEVKVPSPGESINEVELTTWLVKDGDIVTVDQEIAEIESDKATLTLNAVESGKISIAVPEGSTVKVGSVACTIDTGFKPPEHESQPEPEKSEKPEAVEEKTGPAPKDTVEVSRADKYGDVKVTPLAKKVMEQENINIEDVINGLKKLTTKDVRKARELLGKSGQDAHIEMTVTSSRDIEKKKMSQLRKKLAQRLVSVKNETAMLTTFNEIDMSAIIEVRKKYQTKFVEKHGIKLGFMSFFIKASALALKQFPAVNSMIDGEEILTPQYVDVSIAVQTPKGLMVPVIRNAETQTLAEIETELKNLAEKARKGRLSLDEMKGGTFTVTNGGVFGSMLSTPLINPPQAAILGMHNIVERPMAVDGNVEVRPVMYVALSYDHRIIDGRDSVGFLVKVKEMLEEPVKLLFSGNDPLTAVLDL